MAKAYDVAVDQQLSVVLCPDHVVRSKSSGIYCANSLSGVFPEGRGKVDSDSGFGSFAWPERYGGQSGCIKMTSIDLEAFYVNAFTKGSEGASKDFEFVCWYCEKQQ